MAVAVAVGRVTGRASEALRNWIRQDEADCGERGDRPTTTYSLLPHGRHSIDGRDQVFIPARARVVFGIGAGVRVVLVAVPESGMLIVHPSSVIQDVLWDYYASLLGGLGAG